MKKLPSIVIFTKRQKAGNHLLAAIGIWLNAAIAALLKLKVRVVRPGQVHLELQKKPSTAEVLALKHESRILGQLSNPVSGSRKSHASSPWAEQHRV